MKTRRNKATRPESPPSITTRPKQGNPNIVEVFETYDDQNNYFAQRDDTGNRSNNNNDDDNIDMLIDVMDEDDMNVSIRNNNTRKRPLENQQQPIGLQTLPTFDLGNDGSINMNGGEGERSTTTGLLFGAPYEKFTFEHLKMQLERKARMMTNPVVKFIADIAVKTGSTLDNMLVNKDLPLVNTRATSVQELIHGSKLSADLLIPLLAMTVLETIKTMDKTTVTPEMEEKPGSSGDPLNTTEDVDSCIYSAHSFIDSHMQFTLIGAKTDPSETLLELKNILRDTQSDHLKEWAWNAMPENSQLVLVKPEVLAVIETAYEDIRRISPAHSEFKLKHLMTSPSVCHGFALMIAGMLNAAPSEIQYPHYQNNARGNGAVTGSRVSSGLWTQVRNAKLYKEKLLWFRSVHYTESTAWKEIQKRLPQSQSNISIMKNQLKSALDETKKETKALWDQFGFAGDEADTYRIAIADLYDRQQRLRNLEDKKKPITDSELSPDAKKLKLENLQRTIRETVNQIVAVQKKVRNEARLNDGREWKLSFLTDAVAVIPFVGFGGELQDKQYSKSQPFKRDFIPKVLDQDRNSTDADIVFAMDNLIRQLQVVLDRLPVWDTNKYEEIRTQTYTTLSVVNMLKNAYSQYRITLERTNKDLRASRTFTADDKVELIYSRPSAAEIPPMRNFMQRDSIFAVI